MCHSEVPYFWVLFVVETAFVHHRVVYNGAVRLLRLPQVPGLHHQLPLLAPWPWGRSRQVKPQVPGLFHQLSLLAPGSWGRSC